MSAKKKGLLERLDAGEIIIGDGGFIVELERRGYARAGPWTPEAVVEHPEAVSGLHREFLRAGSDVLQTCTFHADPTEDKKSGRIFSCREMNDAACRLAHEVADQGGALVAGGITQAPKYLRGMGKEKTQEVFQTQIDMFLHNKVDFLIAEYFELVEEIEWAIEVLKSSGLPVCSTMCIGPDGDQAGVSAGECAVRMARAGADVIGVNCHFDPFTSLQCIRLMKAALSAAGLSPYLMMQPAGVWTPDANRRGFVALPEFPLSMEPRVLTRWEMQRFARQAFELGVRYIGGCCHVQSHHVRAVAEELHEERGRLPASHAKHGLWGAGLQQCANGFVAARACRQHWEELEPATGRVHSPAKSRPEA